MLGKPTNSKSAVCFNIVQTGGNFEGNDQRWFGCPIEPKKCLKSIYDKTHILCRPHISRSIESFWYGPYLLTPYIISQCENHTIQERKCLPTFILAIIVNFNGFEETIANFQWFLRRPSPLHVFWRSDHWHQWFFNGFWILLPLLSMVFDGSGPLVKQCNGFNGSLWSRDIIGLLSRRNKYLRHLVQA